MAVCTACGTSAFITFRGTVSFLGTPKFHLLFLCAFYTSLTHFSVVLNLGLSKLSVFPEYDVEAQSEYAKSYKDDSCYQYFHINK